MAEPAPRLGGVPFTEAIEFYRQKVRLPTRAWTDLMGGQHARAFVVAGAQSADLVADFHEAVTAAIADGRTLEQFRGDFDRIVAQHGWSYNGSRGWRSRVIFQTNVRMAYAAGRWQQAQRLKRVRPYLRYVAVLDARTRPLHRAWHDTILPVDHPWWATHYPPNGWNCRCSTQSLSERDLGRYGLKVSDQAPPVDWETRTINTPDGAATLRVPVGVDTGFGYNVGQAGYGRGAENAALEAHGGWEPLLAPGAPALDLAPLQAVAPRARLGPRAAQRDEAALRQALRDAIGGDEAVLTDPTGARVTVGQAVVDHMLAAPARQDGREAFFPLIPELVEDPQEIWIGFAVNAATGRVALRRRYVKLVRAGRDRTIGLVADAEDGMWSGLTFFRGDPRGAARLRTGLRIHGK